MSCWKEINEENMSENRLMFFYIINFEMYRHTKRFKITKGDEFKKFK